MLHSALQNSTAGFYIFASDSTTPTTGKTGLTLTVTLSKAGGSANSVSPSQLEIGNGLYWIAPIAAHRDTLGEIAWQFSGTGAIIAPRLEKVVAVNDQVAAFGANTTAPDNSTIGSIYSVLQLTDADVATLLTRIVGTLASGTHNAQSGDAFARLGAPAGASIAADIASVGVDLTPVLEKLPESGRASTQASVDAIKSDTKLQVLINTTINTLASQTSFTLTAGSIDNDTYVKQTAIITDSVTATQKAVATIIDYDGSTKTVTLKELPAFTIAAGDSIAIIAGSSGGSQAVTLQLGATIPLTLGQVTGLTQDLVVGNSYTQELGTRIPVTLTDASGNAIDTTFGDRALSDSTCTIKCVLHPMNARNTDNVTAAAQGDCEFVPASGSDPASLWIELPKTQTDKLSPGMYSIQFHAIWDDGETVTIAWKGQCRFVRIIRPKN